MEPPAQSAVDLNPSPDVLASADSTNAILAGQVRHALTLLAGIAATKGWIDASMSDALIAVVMTLGVMAWSAWVHSQAGAKLNAAIAAGNMLGAALIKITPDASSQVKTLSTTSMGALSPSPQPAPAAPAGGAAGFVRPGPNGFVLPRPVALLALLSFSLLSLSPFLFTGCAQVRKAEVGVAAAIASPTGQKVISTVEIVGIDALKVAAQSLLNSAVSGADSSVKSDYLYSAANGLATQALSVNAGNDVASIVKLWTPAASPGAPQHWSDLANNAAATFDATLAQNPSAPKAAVVQAISAALQDVAKTAPANSDGLPMLRERMRDGGTEGRRAIASLRPLILSPALNLSVPPSLAAPAPAPHLRASPLPELRDEAPAKMQNADGETIYFAAGAGVPFMVRGDSK